MKVYALFEIYGDGDSNTTADLISLHENLLSVRGKIREIFDSKAKLDLAHINMCEENNYLYVGKRENLLVSVRYEHLGGYVAELIEVEE